MFRKPGVKRMPGGWSFEPRTGHEITVRAEIKRQVQLLTQEWY